MIKKIVSLAIMFSLFYIACSDKPNVAPTVTFNLYVQDGMADYDSVEIVIDSVYGYVELDSTINSLFYTGPDTIDIARFRNGRQYHYFEVDLASGELDGVDLVFGNGRVFTNNSWHEMALPDNAGSLRVRAEGRIALSLGHESNGLVDINLFESINYDNETQSYSFSPSIRFIDSDSSGALFGRTVPQADIFIFPMDSEDTLTYSRSEGDSLKYGFYGLTPGQYDILMMPIGADTLIYGALFNTGIWVIAGDEFDLLLLDLPILDNK